MNKKIFLISGPPGAGKSTLATAIAQLFDKSIHIDCDSLYNMVQGGHKKPWEDGADTLLSLMYKVLVLQAETYLQAGFVVISDYVWSPKELYCLFGECKHADLFYPIILLPKKTINLVRDLSREYSVGSDRVATCWENFATWQYIFAKIFYDNSNILPIEIAKNIVKKQGFNDKELEQFYRKVIII